MDRKGSYPKPKVSAEKGLIETERLKNNMYAKFTLIFKGVMCTALGSSKF